MIALAPMAVTALSWLAFFLMFSGLGLAVLARFRQRALSGRDWYDSFWLGWSVSLIVLQLWHLAFPVNAAIVTIFALVAVAALFRERDSLLVLIRKILLNRPLLALLLLCLLWMSNRALEMPDASDTGFRDMQAVMWIASHPVVPGLNNLFASLAYNHSVYLYDALLDVSIWSGRAQHIATGLLVMAYLVYPLDSAIKLWRIRDGNGPRWSWIFAVLTIPYVFYYTVGRGGLSHFLTDTPVDLIGFLLVIYTLDYLQCGGALDKQDDYLLSRIAILVIVGLTIKFTFVPFGMSIALLVFVTWLLRRARSKEATSIVGMITPVALLALCAIVPWMIRGVLTSGYVAYPLSFGRVEVEWAEPVELIEYRQERLATNTRRRYGDSDEVLSSWAWVGPWLQKISADVANFALPVGITVLALAVCAAAWRRQPSHGFRQLSFVWIFLPIAFTLATWFLTFPNIKYVRFVLWSSASLAVLTAVCVRGHVHWRAGIRGTFLVLCVSLLWGLHLVLAQGTYPLLLAPPGGFHDHPLPPVKVVETDSGLLLNVPNSHIPQCWQIPLPCTPYPRAGIYELVPGEYWRGFGFRADESADQNGS